MQRGTPAGQPPRASPAAPGVRVIQLPAQRPTAPLVPWREQARVSRRIFGQAFRLLRGRPGLWAFALLSVGVHLLSLLIIGGLVVGALVVAMSLGMELARLETALVLVLLLLYYPFHVMELRILGGLAYAVHERLEGRACSNRRAWSHAGLCQGSFSRLAWLEIALAGAAYLLGVLLARLGVSRLLLVVLRIIGSMAWGVATFFIVPILVVERHHTVTAALRRSVALVRQQWGPALIGTVAVGAATAPVGYVLLALFLAGVGALVAWALSGGLSVDHFIVALVGLCGVFIVLALAVEAVVRVVSTVYAVVLFRYARTGTIDAPFDHATLVDAWRPYGAASARAPAQGTP